MSVHSDRCSRTFRGALAAGVTVLVVAGLTGSIELPGGQPGRPDTVAPPRFGELPENRTQTSATRRNRDGTMTTTLSAAPMHYRATDGSWQPIDASLHRDARNGYAWRSGANVFEARFRESAEPGFMEFQIGGRALRVTAEGAAPRAGRADGATVTYPGAYPGADLAYTVTASGVSKVIDLAGPDSPTSYTFRLSAADGGPPLTAHRRADGAYLVNASPAPFPAFTLDAPTVSEGASPVPVADAKPQLRVEQAGRDLVATLSLDAGWLREPGRQFPVHLDPTITVQPAIRDGSIQTVSTAKPVSGALMIGSFPTGAAYRSLSQFDFSAVPTGAQVTSATLGLYFDGFCLAGGDNNKRCGGDHQIDVHRLTSAWGNSTTFSQITHDPAVTSTFTLFTTTPLGWMSWPVTGVVSGWLNGTLPNHGLVLKRRTEPLNTGGLYLPGRGHTARAPKIDVTYTLTGPYLNAPTTRHANGAELSWTASGTGGTAGYEVHRAASASFTPGATTLLTTTRDPGITTYRDTTAAAGGTFTYKVKDLTDGTVSVGRTVTLPAAGLATKVLQPGASDGRATHIWQGWGIGCYNFGRSQLSTVGAEVDMTSSSMIPYRGAFHFDLRDIPQGATVTNATMALWRATSAGVAMTVQAHRITRPWKEGTGNGLCTGDGASWDETEGGQHWTAWGGDIDPAVAASAPVSAYTDAVFDSFNLTGLVQGWASGGVPNHGVMLRASDEETLSMGLMVGYAADDFPVPGVRPKLTVTYTDDSPSEGARVVLSAPGPGATVSGGVPLVAAAEDDRRVDLVEFLVNGSSVGSDSVAPFGITWNSVPGGNGTRTVTLRATDDVGNVTTSAPVPITVDNTAPPSITLTATAPTVSGDVTLNATAADDVGVSTVAFLVDGVKVGEDNTLPYSVTWRTLDPLAPAFNGAHQLSALVTDTSGQQVVAPSQAITVNNTGTSTAKVEFKLNDPVSTVDDVFPSVMAANTATTTVQDPYASVPLNPDGTSGGSLNRALATAPVNDGGAPPAGCPTNAYCPTVTVTNRSGATWASSGAQVWYRWYAPNGAVMFEGRSTTAFPATFADGASQAFPVTIQPPALPPGVEQGTYRLRVDVYDPATATWFAAKGNAPLDNPIIVAKELATKMGLERYYQYDGDALGAGMTALTNVANGNMIWRWSPFFTPGRGLATMVDLTYNSLEDHSKSPAGNNVSLSMSGLIRLGEPMDIHPNKADEISGNANKFVEFTDGDGSVHRFTGTTGTDGITRWQEPPGVNLYLRSLPTTDPRGRWALTRPDKVTYIFDVDGFPTMVEDRNGNRITYALQDTPPGEDPGGPKKRVTAVTDAGGRSFTIDYWAKDEIKKAHVRGKIQTIRDHTGSRLDFDYYEDGNLLRLTQRGGTKANGEFLPDRSFVFTYTTSNGAGPAIPLAADRVNPAPRTPNQSTRLFSVRDPRGAETTYAYYQANEGQHLRWKLKTRTDRAAVATSYAYDLTNRITTVTAPMSRVTRFTYDVTGKVTSILNAKSQTIGVEWSTDFKVTKVVEPTGRSSTYTYNPNGYLLTRTNQAAETTEVTYLDEAVDANDAARHLSKVATVTKPKGVATPTVAGDFQWRYSYDPNGNLDKVTDPTGAVTDYDYSGPGTPNPGTLAAVRDANGNPATTYPVYDPSGQPTEIRDPMGGVTRMGYDPDGLVRWVQDPNHAGDSGLDERAYKTFFDYDSFHRLGRQSAPKSTATDRGNLLWSGADFDANDNTVREFDPHYGPITGDPGTTSVTTTTYDVMDRRTLETGPDTSADPAGERTRFDYDAASRLIKITKPKGVQSSTVDDYATVSEYDPLDRVIKRIEYGTSTAQARVTQMCYDLAGDLRSVTRPRAGAATITCPGTGPAVAPFTTETDFDSAHRPVEQRDDLGHAQRTTYDANGNVTSREKDIATGRSTRTEIEYDQRDAPVLSRERVDAATGRNATTRIEYDRNGNRSRLISPRGFDTGGATGPYTFYVTSYSYDANNRLTRITAPFNADDGAERHYTHRAYDANGNVLWNSLPVTTSTPGSVGDRARTVMTYFDPGWVRTSDDPTNPKVHFDYEAQGWQAERVPETASGSPDDGRTMTWEYFLDGQLESRKDQGGHASTYTYDANNNLIGAVDRGGVTDPGDRAVETQSTYTGFDEVAKVRHRKQAETVWKFTNYTYDANGNITIRNENGEENDAGTQTKAPRRYELTYDGVDWLTQQLDLGTDSACADDTRTVNQWQASGWERQRDVYRAAAGCVADPTTWPKKQTTTWTHFDNGKLRKLETRNGSGAITESHDVSYVDSTNAYVNGHRVSDRYVLERTDGNTAQTCRTSSPCDAKYEYDARDRLTRHQQRLGKENRYTFDEPAKLLGDNTVRAGNVTTEVKNGTTTSRKYTGTQVTEATIGPATAKYWYDPPTGNLDCVTTSSGSAANCSPSDGGTASNLIADYGYDYLNRLTTSRMYSGSTRTDMSTYTYDALDRTTKETEDHQDPGKDRTTTFTYQGVTNLVTEEKQDGGTNPKTKTYAYDNYGHKLQMTDRNNTTGATETFTYGTDVHGSISQLITDAGKVKASYGYDAYGGSDAPSSDTESLTTGDTDNQAPLNPYRFSGKRMDSGTVPSVAPAGPAGASQYDMGARRFGPDISTFLQQDMFYTALGDLGLALDPLTQNTYSLAGGNPISYVEYDGHMLMIDGGGGGSTSPNPTTSGSGASSGSTGSDSGGGSDSSNPDWGERLRPNWRTFLNAGLDFTSEWLKQRGEDAIEFGRLKAGLHLLRARTPSPNRLMRLPGVRSLRESYWNSRARFSEAKGNFIGKTLGAAGKAVGVAGTALSAWEGWNEQQKLDANRGDLSSTERNIRSGVRAGIVAGTSVGLAAAGGSLCGPLCAAAGGWAGQHVGNFIADRAFDVVDNVDWSPEGNNVGEQAWNLTKDVGGAVGDTLNPFD